MVEAKDRGAMSEKRNEILNDILQEEYAIDITSLSDFYRSLIDLIPIRIYDKRSLNSLKHGMNTRELLPCKLKKCVYSEQCPLYQSGALESIEVGSPCRMELSSGLGLIEGLEKEYSGRATVPDIGILADFVIACVLRDRNSRMIALESGFLRREGVSRRNNNGFSLGYRYWLEARRKINASREKVISGLNTQ